MVLLRKKGAAVVGFFNYAFDSSKEGDRFEMIFSQGLNARAAKAAGIICDKVTGVQYLLYAFGDGSTLVPLLDRDGKPLLHNS